MSKKPLEDTDAEFLERITGVNGLMGQLTDDAMARLARIVNARKMEAVAAEGAKHGAALEDVVAGKVETKD